MSDKLQFTRRARRAFAGLALMQFALLAGCQQIDRVFYSPTDAPIVERAQPQPMFRLAALSADEPKTPEGFTEPATESTTTEIGTNGATAKPVTAPAYTAPQFAMLPFVAATGQFNQFNTVANANAAQAGALIGGSQGITGRAGLTAPSAAFGTTLVSRPGLQEGLATGLSFATPGRTVFDAQRNTLSGTNGRCAELTRAGFFGGDRAACERAGRK